MASKPPTIFLWYRQAAPSLFLKKRWWGRKLFPFGKEKSAAFGRRKRFVPACGAECSALPCAVLSGAASPRLMRAASRQKRGAAFAAILKGIFIEKWLFFRKIIGKSAKGKNCFDFPHPLC